MTVGVLLPQTKIVLVLLLRKPNILSRSRSRSRKKEQELLGYFSESTLPYRALHAPMSTPVTPQISWAYSAMARSLENLPLRATFRMDMRAQRAESV